MIGLLMWISPMSLLEQSAVSLKSCSHEHSPLSTSEPKRVPSLLQPYTPRVDDLHEPRLSLREKAFLKDPKSEKDC